MGRLDERKISYSYEAKAYKIELEVSGQCRECGGRKIARTSRFTPDFFFPVWVVEAKGKFTPRDRKRVLALKQAHPEMKFAMVFMRDNWLTKTRTSRYTDWCKDHDIPCSVGWFNEEWLR